MDSKDKPDAETISAQQRKRTRRVSFAETTSIHLFNRDSNNENRHLIALTKLRAEQTAFKGNAAQPQGGIIANKPKENESEEEEEDITDFNVENIARELNEEFETMVKNVTSCFNRQVKEQCDAYQRSKAALKKQLKETLAALVAAKEENESLKLKLKVSECEKRSFQAACAKLEADKDVLKAENEVLENSVGRINKEISRNGPAIQLAAAQDFMQSRVYNQLLGEQTASDYTKGFKLAVAQLKHKNLLPAEFNEDQELNIAGDEHGVDLEFDKDSVASLPPIHTDEFYPLIDPNSNTTTTSFASHIERLLGMMASELNSASLDS